MSWVGGRAWAGAGGCQSRAPAPGSSWRAQGALAGSRERRETAPCWAQETPRGISWLPAGARQRGLLQPAALPRPWDLHRDLITVQRIDSLCARLQQPPLNPPLPLNLCCWRRVSSRNRPPAGGRRRILLPWEQGTHMLVCDPRNTPNSGAGGSVLRLLPDSWKSSLIHSFNRHLGTYHVPGTIHSRGWGDTS